MSFQCIQQRQPLVLCLTNSVAANFTANGLLAVGASPLMSEEKQEMEELVAIADAVLLNIGTIHEATKEAMHVAGRAANERSIPVILDPVGIGASTYRLRAVEELLQTVRIQCIRCNAGELAVLAGEQWETKGVDSGNGKMAVATIAQKVAQTYGTFVFVTGEADIVTDGTSVIEIRGGDARMTKVTATGCLLSALTAAVCATENNMLQGLAQMAEQYKAAATLACQQDGQVGTIQYAFLNALQQMAEEVIVWKS